jgi:VanZ family protein
MPDSKGTARPWWPVLEWLLAIVAGTTAPVPEGIGGPWLKRIAEMFHLVGSAILSFLTFRALRRSLDLSRGLTALSSGFLGGLVMTLSEARQGSNPSRMSLLSDAIWNLVGVVLGGVTAAVLEDRQ